MSIEMSEPVPVDTIISDLAKAVSQATDRALALARFTDEKTVEAVVEKAVEKALEDRTLDAPALDETIPDETTTAQKETE